MTDVRRRRLLHQLRDQPLGGRQTPHGAVRDVLHGAARSGGAALRRGDEYGLQRGWQSCAEAHRADGLARAVERETERFGREVQHRQTGFAWTRRWGSRTRRRLWSHERGKGRPRGARDANSTHCSVARGGDRRGPMTANGRSPCSRSTNNGQGPAARGKRRGA